MGNETRRILDLLAQGKVTADEAEQLISAINQPQEAATSVGETAAPGAPPAEKKAPKWLRVVVFKVRPEDAGDAGAPRDEVNLHLGQAGSFTVGRARKGEVNVRIPLALVRAGMKLGAMMPGVAGEQVNRHMREHGIDLSKIDPAHIEDVMKELGDMTIDVDDGKNQVRVFCE
jgi:hypothetical protein